MLFNSFAFTVFLPVVFLLYWVVFNRRDVRLRNFFLLVVSYVFYGWWDWRFLSLIILSAGMDFWIGRQLHRLNLEGPQAAEGDAQTIVDRQRKRLLWTSIVLNIGILGIFKYFNFFADSLTDLAAIFGATLSPVTLQIVLPVGISFYTFQTLSYSIDLYRKKTEPAKDWVQFFAFVSFFPQLVAGPIERARNLLPQFENLKRPDHTVFRTGMLLIAWGFFKKIMVADRLAVFVEQVYADPAAASGFPMLLATLFFAFQLYLDFSAYSDIARGTASLFGFELMQNFNSPYLSTSFGAFWKRWHISLSSWFMDYVYIPLGGNRLGRSTTMRNILIVFAVSGLWHGASWNFVIWGTLNGLFLIALDPLLGKRPKLSRKGQREGLFSRILKPPVIFTCWAISLIFFRAKDFGTAWAGFQSLGFDHMDRLGNFGLNQAELQLSFLLLAVLLVQEILWSWKGSLLQAGFHRSPVVLRWAYYTAIVLVMVYFGQYGSGNEHSFIYFQF